MFCDKSETMKTSRLALVVLTAGLLCVGNAVGQNDKKAESDAAVVAFEKTLAEAKDGDGLTPHPQSHLETTARNQISYQLRQP